MCPIPSTQFGYKCKAVKTLLSLILTVQVFHQHLYIIILTTIHVLISNGYSTEIRLHFLFQYQVFVSKLLMVNGFISSVYHPICSFVALEDMINQS